MRVRESWLHAQDQALACQIALLLLCPVESVGRPNLLSSTSLVQTADTADGKNCPPQTE